MRGEPVGLPDLLNCGDRQPRGLGHGARRLTAMVVGAAQQRSPAMRGLTKHRKAMRSAGSACRTAP
jgi:hypothetical protein